MMKTPVWIVTNVQPQKDYTLILTFASGEKKLFDARPLLAKAIYKPLTNLSFFLTAKAGTVNSFAQISSDILAEV